MWKNLCKIRAYKNLENRFLWLYFYNRRKAKSQTEVKEAAFRQKHRLSENKKDVVGKQRGLPDNSSKQIFWEKATIRMKGNTMSE